MHEQEIFNLRALLEKWFHSLSDILIMFWKKEQITSWENKDNGCEFDDSVGREGARRGREYCNTEWVSGPFLSPSVHYSDPFVLRIPHS